MQPSAAVGSSSSSAAVAFERRERSELGAAYASLRAMVRERLFMLGAGMGMLTLLSLPLFQVAVLALLYGTGNDLLGYIVVAQAANALVITSLFFVGEILDRERLKGTLVSLFLAPCARFAWLSGFMLSGLVETSIMATMVLLFGHFALGVQFDPNLPAVAVTALLFLVALWGCGVMFSGIGLLIRKANALSNLLYSFVILLGGAYFPISSLPEPFATIARCLPLGYGMQALADASLENASWSELAPNLLPLAGFAVALPIAGACAFHYLERMVRVRGELDLY